LSEQKCFFFIIFIFLCLRFFLVKRHKTFFGFGFKSFFLDWLYFYFGFGFWLSVRNGFLYFVFGFGFYIFYFILANRLASPFLFGLPLFILISPIFYLVLLTNLFYFYLSSIRYCCCYCYCFKSSSCPRPRSSIVRTCKMC
jgi:hypothetical protein